MRRNFRAEYAKGHSQCNLCWEKITMGDLRLTPAFCSAGKGNDWFHLNCFFIRTQCRERKGHDGTGTLTGHNRCGRGHNPREAGLIENFDCLRWEDQEKISKSIGEETVETRLEDFKTQYYEQYLPHKSMTFLREEGKTVKCICEDRIKEGEVVIWKKDQEATSRLYKLKPSQYCGQDPDTEFVSSPILFGKARGYHLNCFAKTREKLDFLCSGEKLPGLYSLSLEDRDMIIGQLPDVERKGEEKDSKRARLEVEEDPTENTQKEERKKQNKKMFHFRDLLRKNCKRKDLYSLLDHNKQDVSDGVNKGVVSEENYFTAQNTKFLANHNALYL